MAYGKFPKDPWGFGKSQFGWRLQHFVRANISNKTLGPSKDKDCAFSYWGILNWQSPSAQSSILESPIRKNNFWNGWAVPSKARNKKDIIAIIKSGLKPVDRSKNYHWKIQQKESIFVKTNIKIIRWSG